MGRLFICYLEGRVYSCKACRAHLAKVDELVSKSFHCRHGKAYLFNDVVNVKSVGKDVSKQFPFFKIKVFEASSRRYITAVNVTLPKGPKEERLMTTGLHTVADIYCNKCLQIVGWKYEEAFEKSQKYKEGKFILERAKMTDEADDALRGVGGGLLAEHLGSDGEEY